MPKYGIHHVVLSEAIEPLGNSSTEAVQKAAAVLDSNRGIAMLGAIGPDLFFWAPDYDLVDKLHILYQNINAIVELYNDTVQPITDICDAVVGEPLDAVLNTLAPNTKLLIEAAVEGLETTASLFQAAVGTRLFADVISGFNFSTDLASLPSASAQFFRQFTPPRQDNKGEADWYWFDMLHYRKTGDFARRLVENASTGTDRQRAYAYGYLSHIATDLAGHGYVNQIVGGPYRLHVQRHVTVENYIDSWKFQQQYGESINLTLFDRLGLEELPEEICSLLDGAFHATYTNVPHPTLLSEEGFLTPEQIHQTYEIFYEVLNLMKNMVILPPEEPFSGVAQILEDVLSDLLEPPPQAPSSPISGCSWEDILSFGTTAQSRQCYEDFFRQLTTWFAYLGELAEWLFETLVDLIDLLLAVLMSIPVTVLLAILYGIQLLLYDIYQTARSSLALEGFVYPEPDDLNSSHGLFLTTTYLSCTPQPRELTYPHQTALNVSHLVCPSSPLENPYTAPDFNNNWYDVTPDEFINIVPFDAAAFAAYAGASSPQATRDIHSFQGLRVGNATDLTKWLITVAAAGSDAEKESAFTNFDLDGDRGYFYRTWQGNIGSTSVTGESFVP
jgi:hypothetical protein